MLLYAYLALNGLYQLGIAIFTSRRSSGEWDFGGMLISLLMGGVFLVGAFFGIRAWIREGKRQYRVELNASHLIVHDYDRSRNPRVRSWARSRIASITVGPVPWTAPESQGLGLHIRISGDTIHEVLPGHPAEVANWLAERLNEALAFPCDKPHDALPPIAGDPHQTRTNG